MFDFKTEVEHYTGQKIDINKYIDQAQKEAKSRGHKIDVKYVKAIKKEFAKRDKRRKHRAVWFAQCAELDIPYSSFEADETFELNYAIEKSVKGHNNDVKVEDVPIPIMVGVSVSLAGLFLVFVPIPLCQTAGVWLINTGVSILGSDAIQRWEAYDKDQKLKK